MKSLTLFFGHNGKSTTSLKEYGDNYDRIFKEPKPLSCLCGKDPIIIGDGIKPSYGTIIQCPDECGQSMHISVMNKRGTGGTLNKAIRRWNLQF